MQVLHLRKLKMEVPLLQHVHVKQVLSMALQKLGRAEDHTQIFMSYFIMYLLQQLVCESDDALDWI